MYRPRGRHLSEETHIHTNGGMRELANQDGDAESDEDRPLSKVKQEQVGWYNSTAFLYMHV